LLSVAIGVLAVGCELLKGAEPDGKPLLGTVLGGIEPLLNCDEPVGAGPLGSEPLPCDEPLLIDGRVVIGAPYGDAAVLGAVPSG
jgi:hypothetical protein